MDQATKASIQNDVSYYKEFQNLFVIFCEDLINALNESNQHDIELGVGDTISRNLKILDHPCKIDFGIHRSRLGLRGKMIFYRLISPEQKELFWTLYFDNAGNTYNGPEWDTPLHSLKGNDITNWIVPQILQYILKNLVKPT